MQEVNDCERTFNEGTGQNRSDDKKERDLGQEVAPCFALKIIAADIQKRSRRFIRTSREAIERKGLVIALDQREPASSLSRREAAIVCAIDSLSGRFHSAFLY